MSRCEALVLRWDSHTLRVRCPYCLYSHKHGFGWPEEDVDRSQPGWKLCIPGKQRASSCPDGHEYTFVFPGTDGSIAADYGWEVDRDSREFVTVNYEGKVGVPINDSRDGRTLLQRYKKQHQPTFIYDDTDSETDELAAATESFSLGEREEKPTPRQDTAEEQVEELYRDPHYRLTEYFSHCVLKDIRGLEMLFRHYPGDRFIGSVNRDGDTGAICAATEENGLETLRWLHDRGGSIVQANHYGRTPLMEAALWGRLDTVRYLTQQNIPLSARDGNGMRAIDLATDTDRNTKERTKRSAIYREPADARRQRELIRAHLERLTSPKPARVNIEAAPQRQAFFYRRSDGKLDIYRPQESLESPLGRDGPQLQKAFATLDRGPNYPYIIAMSGFSHPGWPNVLDNKVWTDKAAELRQLLGLPEKRSAASHVEPQLLAYLFDRHSLFMFQNKGHDNGYEDEDDEEDLASAMPAYTLKPIITVNKRGACEDCVEFFHCLKNMFPGLNVEIRFAGELTNTDAKA